ncbi:Bicupin, oxalate decarboxylase/oxidase [Aspergillus saccharolyticus JOP 1030-1]|uniref:Bicupin, oxalate decarboxylase/oxidase n=1 Tax=Aspergillus saccharolyticus JOP 1030-1 TaxID=1450539 RepID=A0A318ZKN1_9EURO|nr:Bicupin, oxalate decarboxylase/oxidase [Aspergillus saccharolyticus JOP 1030-1]PYH48066.1 Bicupin, oxalate decarboxylase/oxidase [Aspergillus saccharolyticus JOP 1030-1]
MQLLSRSPLSLLAVVAVAGLVERSHAGPVPNDAYQQLMQIPASSPSIFFNHKEPFSPDHRDPWDHKVDAIGEGRQPLPWRMGDGASMMGPRNKDRERQNPDLVRPPSTDHGSLPNMRWSFADSHVRIEEGGWTRQTTVRELGTSKELAGVNMRLDRGAYRELHWHIEAEWAYVLAGQVRVTGLDLEGKAFIDDLEKGDLWYFPSGHPHSLQGLGENGTEFLLIFDDGNFSEESTFLLTDWMAHTPKAVLAENFRLRPQLFKNIPTSEKYIFSGSHPDSIPREIPPNFKPSSQRFTHKMLAQEPEHTSGGEVRITDSSNFPISKTVAAAHLTIQPGALREMHWHPNADEWSYFIRGRARVTVFAAEGNARTFDYVAGDVGIVPKNMGHFIENLSDEEEVEVLEIFRADRFRDFSLLQWMGETPRRNVAEHLFQEDPEAAREFLRSVEGAEKDPIRG